MNPEPNQTGRCWIKNALVRRLGAGAFLFFLIKGLLWLIVPTVLAWASFNAQGN